jgi:hypothetical protein
MEQGLSREAAACLQLARDTDARVTARLPQPPMGEPRRAALVPNADKYRQRMERLKGTRVGHILFGDLDGLVQPIMQRRAVIKLKLLSQNFSADRLVVDFGYAQLVFLIKIYLPWAMRSGDGIEQEEAATLIQYLMDLEQELKVLLVPQRTNRVLEVLYQTCRSHRFYGASEAELKIQLSLSGCYFRMTELVQQLSLRSGIARDPQDAWRLGGDQFIVHEIEILMALARCRGGEEQLQEVHALSVTGTIPITVGRECIIQLSEQCIDGVLDAICAFAFTAVCELCNVETFAGTTLDTTFGGDNMTTMRSVFSSSNTVATGGKFRAHFAGFRLDIFGQPDF